MTKSNLRLVAPITENRTVTPRRPKNADVRSRVGFGAVHRMIADFRDALPRMLADHCRRRPRRSTGVATVLQQKRLGPLQLFVLILPARGPNFVRSNLRTRTILDARGRSPDVPVR